MATQSSPLVPTFHGHISSTLDALLLFEGCLSGQMNHVPRRPHDRERQELIKSGNVFIYEEHASGIKRWTDGVSWSPSRILGNFLIYRELEKPFAPGEKKRALKKDRKPSQGVVKSEPVPRSSFSFSPATAASASALDDSDANKDTERALIGSLIDSYPFKPDGLIKKTISICYQGVPHHLVSYYTVADVMVGRLKAPTAAEGIESIAPRPELLMSQSFRAPLHESEYVTGDRNAPGFFTLMQANGFTGQGTILPRGPMLQNMHAAPAGLYPPQGVYSFGHENEHPQHRPQQQEHQHPHQIRQQQPLHPPQHPFSHPVGSAPPMLTVSPLQSASSVSSRTDAIPYTPQPQGNYALEPNRAQRFDPSAGLAHAFPRNMPTQAPSRRHSAFNASSSSDLAAGMPLGSVPEGRSTSSSNLYLNAPSYYAAQRQAPLAGQGPSLSSSQPMRMQPDTLARDDGAVQQYGLDENSAAWGFDALEGNQEQQFFGGHARS